MIEFGRTLREAREAKGLTIADIAQKTHIMSSMVTDLENEVFTRLAAPIYGRGFIKLYCECVDLDPKPLIAEFMEIFNGNREPAIRERTPVTAPEPPVTAPEPPVDAPEPPVTAPEPPVTAPEPPVHAPEPPVDADESQRQQEPSRQQLDLFSAPTEIPTSTPTQFPFLSQPQPSSQPQPPSQPQPQPQPQPAESRFARYANPLHTQALDDLTHAAPAIGRWCVVAIAFAAVVLGLILGIRALYRATSTVSPDLALPAAEKATATPPAPSQIQDKSAAASKATSPSKNVSAKKNAVRTSRTPIDVPPLYID